MVTKASPWWHVCVQVSISFYSPQCSVLLFKSINKVLLPVLAGERWPQKLVYRGWQQRASVAPLPQTRQRRSEGSGERGTRRSKGGNKTETVRRGEEGLISLVSMSGCETHRQPLSGENVGGRGGWSPHTERDQQGGNERKNPQAFPDLSDVWLKAMLGKLF